MSGRLKGFNRLATFYRPVDEDGTRGTVVGEYVVHFQAWVKITPLGTREAMAAAQVYGSRSHKIEMHRDARLTDRHYLVWNNRRFDLSPALGYETNDTIINMYAAERIG